MTPRITTESRTTRAYTFSGDEILAALWETGRLGNHQTGEQVLIEFHVPGGGDWSNSRIEIDPDHPIHVTVVTEART